MRTVGRYALYDEIGSGGMSAVHLGHLQGPLGFGRIVALKRLRPEYAKDHDFVAMLIDEARLTSRIKHPNVIATNDVVTTDGELFVVMDYVRGESLSWLLRAAAAKGERVAPRLAASIVSSVLHGLHAAHELVDASGELLGVVHRDVSPQNVIVGADGMACVLDFGVAKALGQLHVTRGGEVRGKLAYMAPEHLRGRATRQSDVFSAGIVLWETITGQHRFPGQAADNTSRVLDPHLERPSVVLRANGAHIDGDDALALERLDAIVQRALERTPRARFATAREMALALERDVGCASTAEVADWVEHLASDRLRDRDEKVATIERDVVAQKRVDDSQSSLGVRVPVARGRADARTRYGAVAAVCAFCALAIGWGVSSRDPSPSIAPRPELGSSPQASVERPPPSATPPDSSAVPSSDPSIVGSAQATIKAPRRRTVVVSSSARSSTPHCDPPFSYDEAGRKVFKEECLR